MPTQVYFNLLEACKEPGCPVCRLVGISVQRSLVNLLYENVNDFGVRERLRKSSGFCNEHAWQMLESGSGNSFGIAVIHHDIMKNLASRLPDLPEPSQPRPWWSAIIRRIPRQVSEQIQAVKRALAPQAVCLACEDRDQTTEAVLSELVEALSGEEMAGALENSSGLCLPHLRGALELVQDPLSFRNLLSINRKKIAGLVYELSEFIRKSDYRFQAEGFQAEGDSWRRGVAFVSGENLPGVFS